jgi:hypothetical protein
LVEANRTRDRRAAPVIIKGGVKPIALVGITLSGGRIAEIDMIADPDRLGALVGADWPADRRKSAWREYALRGRRLIGECA